VSIQFVDEDGDRLSVEWDEARSQFTFDVSDPDGKPLASVFLDPPQFHALAAYGSLYVFAEAER
jgi:hypothetical protein